MTDQTPATNWQSIGDLALKLVAKEAARQRDNAPGHDRQYKENGDD